MDRTVIDTWKAEEKELSEQLHRKLTALTTMIQPPTEDFRKCFVEDMFLKPNQKAFFHVMHYLFNLLDPLEFKKRFYWPIADKKSEANFRSSTIQYLMYLNEKHNLQWTNIKSYLVVMPGGMKFILFLLDLIDLITKELIKHREKLLAAEVGPGQLSDFNIQRMQQQNKVHKEYASRYIKATDMQIVSLKEKLEVLTKHMQSISMPTCCITDLLEDSMLTDFASSNRQLFETNLKQNVAKVESIEAPLKTLKENIDRFQNHEAGVKYDKEMVKRSLLKIKLAYPDIEIGDQIHNTDLQMGTLLATFNRIFPDVESNIVAVDQQNNRNDFIGNELSALKTDILQIETQLTKFLSTISEEGQNQKAKATPVRASAAHGFSPSGIFSKFINTPPIRLDMINNKMSHIPRLPFLDDCVMEPTIESFCFGNQQNTFFASMPAPGSTRKPLDRSMKQPPSTLNKSKIVDPLRLLRTLNKDTSKSRNVSRNLSSLASKWKKHESLFGPDDLDSSHIINGEQCQTVITLSVNSPFGSKEKTTVSFGKMDMSLPANALDTSIIYSRKISAVQKVQDASLNFHNLSTSPSGRLDPLVPFDPKEFPKILLNDRTLLETSINNSGLLNVNGTEKCRANYGDLDRSFRAIKKGVPPDENDPNASNIGFDFTAKMANISSDALFDISDGVLKDITM